MPVIDKHPLLRRPAAAGAVLCAVLALAACETVPIPDDIPDPLDLFEELAGLDGLPFDPSDPASFLSTTLVVLGDGEPVQATVSINGETLTTGPDGSLELSALPPLGQNQATVRAAGFMPRTVSLSFADIAGLQTRLVGLRSADAMQTFDAATGGQVSIAGVTVSIPAGALVNEARDSHDGPATVSLEVALSGQHVLQEDGSIRQRFDLESLPFSPAGPFLAPVGEGGATEQVIPLAATRFVIHDDAGQELELAPGQAATVTSGVHGLMDEVTRLPRPAVFSDDFRSATAPDQDCTLGTSTDQCPSHQAGLLATLGEADDELRCTRVAGVTLQVPASIRVVSKKHRLEAVLPGGQLTPVTTSIAVSDGQLRVWGAHSRMPVQLATDLMVARADEPDDPGEYWKIVTTHDDLEPDLLPVDGSWTSTDEAHAACGALDWAGATTVTQVVPDVFAPPAEDEAVVELEPTTIETCDDACGRVAECGRFPSAWGEDLDACRADCESGLAEDPEFVGALFDCLAAAACQTEAIDNCVDATPEDQR